MTIWRDHITPLLLRERHWLPIQERIDYKLFVLSAWTCSILPDKAHHAVRQLHTAELDSVGWVEDRGSTAHTFITWRSGVCRRSTPCMEQSAVLHSCNHSADRFSKNLKTRLFNVAFNSCYFAYGTFSFYGCSGC